MAATAESVPVRRALISVSDKTGIVDLARALHDQGVALLSTGGTARLLAEAGLPVTEVAEYTGFPEIMDGRVKTLHPRVHGGLLGRRGTDDAVMAEQGIPAIDLLVVNLYPFERTVADPDCTLETAIEHIDIGGPAMLRAAAKNYAGVAVLTDSADYDGVSRELADTGGVSAATRLRLAIAAFDHVARYDAAISDYLSALQPDGHRSAFPGQANLTFRKVADLRYGENPHQGAAFYREPEPAPGSFATFRQRQGKALSYNNLADADAAWACVGAFEAPACVIVKHANPCGVAVAADLASAYDGAFATDPTSAFGGIIAFNRPLDELAARRIIERQFVEVILAPAVSEAALEVIAGRRNVRVLEIPDGPVPAATGRQLQRIDGGLLMQDADSALLDPDGLRTVTRRQPSDAERADLEFVWRVAKYVKSNAIVYGGGGRTLGIGAGQMSRVDSARIGARKAADAGLSLAGAVLASDAFFPFRDGIDQAAEAGVAAVIQPGGSIRDEEVIAAADEHGMAMVFTGMRHFRH
ncbi:bifunctional phosphoribosylaminoimidazolecarboxamide formyltransferase/IMP cyclohydrolase [Sediminicurvatus halobius]|uniref:Bifunctional purine biosynthesis protein PurH n=1 Tax=Sediminicurvatus halobius TaxID=2182432 RepID=A0A2U2MXF4_9GAMM|nr:bifunctional phosphoribosylaminoimidazolecarboxamide formyltransferase/IMP cyclohydrolase [Spiribacter halobius]PWG61550.1 bifunctional phosphoribosylaminoimidazolecarboxamide formyltransferase/inosine monophosphate cyclohydrolase [Spiribacter halobius]UEX77118.1 bifunctional phosphoribosylaminoimidazolecarboxamide formyltransferase/IMP cyclohydrolase [Spiribacter halobius]